MLRNAGLVQPHEGVWGFWGTSIQGKLIATDARVLYVQPNSLEATDLGNTGEDPAVPFATVQAALARCRPYAGDTILVGANDAWTFGGGAPAWRTPIQESILVSVPGVSIIGINPSLGVYWTAAAAGQFCITIAATDVLIDGFVFMGGMAGCNGIYAEWAGGPGSIWFADNPCIRNCIFDDAIDIAIQFEYVWHGIIRTCKFARCDTYGIYVDPAGSGIAECIIDDNYFYDCGAAMALNGADFCDILHNTIFNTHAQGAAVATNEGIDTTAGNANSVHDNTFSCVLPVPANGDWDDLNTAAATDAWVNNHCMNGLAITNPT
jgi:hypothetical protein